MPEVPTPEEWSHANVREVVLPSGAGKVLVRPMSLSRALIGGRIPNPLARIAAKVEYEGVDPSKLPAEERRAYEDFKDWLVASSVVEPEVSVEFVRNEDGRGMPPIDREEIWLHAIHAKSPLLDKVVASLADLASFRGGAGGDAAPGDGTEPRAAAE